MAGMVNPSRIGARRIVLKCAKAKGTPTGNQVTTCGGLVDLVGIELEPLCGRERSENPHAKSRAQRRTLGEYLVDLVGIEPTTSSMPWNDENSNLLTAKTLIVG